MHTEDSAARKACEARDASTALFKTALRNRIPITGPLDGVTVGLYKALRDQRTRADVVPFTKRVAPAPRPAPPTPMQPLRPAALNRFGKLTRAPDRKLRPVTLDATQRHELAQLFLKTVRA